MDVTAVADAALVTHPKRLQDAVGETDAAELGRRSLADLRGRGADAAAFPTVPQVHIESYLPL